MNGYFIKEMFILGTNAQVCDRLSRKYIPEQISGVLLRERLPAPSHTSIYSYIQSDRQCGGGLYQRLRINGKRRYRHRNKGSRHKLPNRIGIEQHPTPSWSTAPVTATGGDWPQRRSCAELMRR